MGLLYAENFDDGLASRRASHGLGGLSLSSSYGAHGNGMRIGDAAGTGAWIYLPRGTSNEIYIGFAFRIVQLGGDNQMTQWADSNTWGGLFYDAANKRLRYEIRINSVTNVKLYTADNSVEMNKWYYFELYQKSNTGSQAQVEMRINGQTHLDYGPFDMWQGISLLRLGSTDSDFLDIWDIDDIYLADDDFKGPSEVVTLYPDGNGNSSDLVGQDANSVDNYLNVDEATPDDGTTYNGSGTEGDKDTYTMDDLATSEDVSGLIVAMNAAKTDSGVKFMRPVIRIGTTDYVGVSQAAAEAYSLLEVPFDTSPATAVAFTPTEINGAEFGSEIRDS